MLPPPAPNNFGAQKSQGLDLKIFHFASAINACAKSNAPDRDEVALRLFNDSRVSVEETLNFLGFAYVVGKIKFKLLFQGPLAKCEQIGIVFGISVGLEKKSPSWHLLGSGISRVSFFVLNEP